MNAQRQQGDHVQVFTDIYDRGLWGGKGYSGIGSSLEHNKTYIPYLQTFLRSVDAKTVADLGCGDFQCGSATYDLLTVSYVGYDVYAPLIDRLNETKRTPRRRFVLLDFCSKPELIEPADVCILKDVLQHWPRKDVVRTLDILCSSGHFRHILVCNCAVGARDEQEGGPDIRCGEWRALSASCMPLRRYSPKVVLRFNTKELSVIDSIPHVAFTTSAAPPSIDYQTVMSQTLGPTWTYHVYLDAECESFMQGHPLEMCPDPCQRFRTLHGPHKADFFRLYALYVVGGVFLDSDVLLRVPLDQLLIGVRLVTVRSIVPGLIFNGIMACTPRHALIGDALKFCYNSPPNVERQDYFWFCRHLFQLLDQVSQPDVKLWTERQTIAGQTDTLASPQGQVVATHYWQSKVVPLPNSAGNSKA